MSEWRLFPDGTVPEWTTPEWYAGRERAPHVEQSAHRGRLLLAADMATTAIHADQSLKSLVDLGCGDGGLLALLQPTSFERDVPMWGYDLQESNVVPAVSERDVDVRYGDVVAGDIEWGDIAVTTEMLEHLPDPHDFVRRIAQHAKVIVASSPFTETDQSHYAYHVWAWDTAGYIALIEGGGFKVVRHQTVDMFQVILGVSA